MMKTQIMLIRIAGVTSLLFMFFHFAFYRMFNWATALDCLSATDRSILYTYHAASIVMTFFMALIPITQTKALLNSLLKYTVLSFFSLFYLLRIVAEFIWFGFTMPSSPVILIMCLIPMVCFAIPVFYTPQNDEK